METKAVSIRTMLLVKSWTESEQVEVAVVGRMGSYTETPFPKCKVLLPDGTLMLVPVSGLYDYAAAKAAKERGGVTPMSVDLKVLAANLQTEQQITHALETKIIRISRWQKTSPAYAAAGGKMNRYESAAAKELYRLKRARLRSDNG